MEYLLEHFGCFIEFAFLQVLHAKFVKRGTEVWMQSNRALQVLNGPVSFSTARRLDTPFVKIQSGLRHVSESRVQHTRFGLRTVLLWPQINLNRVRARDRTDAHVCAVIGYRRIDVDRLA